MTNPDTVQSITDIFDVFDTVRADNTELRLTVQELRRNYATEPDDPMLIRDEEAREEEFLRQRVAYALKSVTNLGSLSALDLAAAEACYVGSEVDQAPHETRRRLQTAKRYSALVERSFATGVVATHALAEVTTDVIYRPVYDTVAVSGTTVFHGVETADDGRVWYDLGNPRTVEVAGLTDKARVVAAYPIMDIENTDNGAATTISHYTGRRESLQASYPTSRIVIDPSSRSWRISEDGAQVELFIPAGCTSYLEHANGGLSALIAMARHDDAAQVAIDATGADLPHITRTFDVGVDNANPFPISVAKTQ